MDAQRKSRSRLLTYLALTIFSLIFLAPLLWNLLYALKTRAESEQIDQHLLPQHPLWSNFPQALTMIDFWGYTLNTLELAGTYSILITLSSAIVGFGFARLRARGRSALFLVMLATSMVPPILTVIPTYIIFTRIHLIDTYWPWVLWGLASAPFLSFLFRQIFSAVPKEMEEAAVLDGCGYWRIFWQIFLPLAKPVLATSIILSFTWVWGDYFTPSIFLSNDKTTLAVAMSYGYVDEHSIPRPNVLAAGVMFYVLPVVAVFFVAQRSFIRGITTTGLKG